MKIKSIKVIKGKNKWSDSKDKLIHMVLDLGEYEQKPSNKIEGFYERIKKYLPSMQSHRCSIGKTGGFFKRVKEGTWMGHIIEHIALELQTLAGYDTGWGRTRGVKGQKGVYNVVFNYEDENKGKLVAREAFNVVNDIINNKNPQIDKIVKKLKSKTLKESIRRILREELNEIRVPREDRDQIYKDENIIVVVPYTHLALKKYANRCQWCINSDREDWENYHKGTHCIIIQRNPQKLKMGITGHPTASEIFTIAKWDNNMSTMEDVEDMLGYIFRSERSMQNYYLDLTKDINNFALNTVYYSPEEGGVFDMEDNYLPSFNYDINDVPNVTPEVIDLIKKHILE